VNGNRAVNFAAPAKQAAQRKLDFRSITVACAMREKISAAWSKRSLIKWSRPT